MEKKTVLNLNIIICIYQHLSHKAKYIFSVNQKYKHSKKTEEK